MMKTKRIFFFYLFSLLSDGSMTESNDLEGLIASVNTEMNRQLEEIRKQWEDLKAEQEAWTSTRKKLELSSGQRIKLDIGGKVFATTKENMVRYPNSFFAGMFSGQWDLRVEDDGCYFIDRDPLVFRYVLNFLRGQPIELDELTTSKKKLLLSDAEYYQLDGLIDLLRDEKIELKFSESGDTNGIVYYLGSKGKTQDFKNPQESNFITVTHSHSWHWGNKEQITTRQPYKTSCGIRADSESWLVLDLKKQLCPTYYTLNHGNSSGYSIGSWSFQGSNDAVTWETLTAHNENGWHTNQYDFAKSWPVNNCKTYFRYFRILQTKPCPNYPSDYCLMISGIEIYGTLLNN